MPDRILDRTDKVLKIKIVRAFFHVILHVPFAEVGRGKTALKISRSGERGAAITTLKPNPVFRGMF
jgi:hypothetical protein